MSTLAWDGATTGWTLARPEGQAPVTDASAARAGTPHGPEAADRTDTQLVEACLAGQAGAFDEVVERHRRAIYQLCYRFVPNHEDALDLSQDVFLRAFRALGQFRGQSSLGTWLYRIGVNVCLSRVSVKRPQTEPIDARAHVDTASESPSERVLRGERAARVRDAVSRLPEKQRAALILRVYQDLTHPEIAAALGTSVGAAKASVFHALRNLKRLLADGEV